MEHEYPPSMQSIGEGEPSPTPQRARGAMKARWRAPVPPVDLRRWWAGYLGHGLEGALAAGAMTAGPALWPELGTYLFGAGALLLAGAIAAQWLGFLRKNDTPSRDVHHILIGYCGGLLGCGAWLWQWG